MLAHGRHFSPRSKWRHTALSSLQSHMHPFAQSDTSDTHTNTFTKCGGIARESCVRQTHTRITLSSHTYAHAPTQLSRRPLYTQMFLCDTIPHNSPSHIHIFYACAASTTTNPVIAYVRIRTLCTLRYTQMPRTLQYTCSYTYTYPSTYGAHGSHESYPHTHVYTIART